MALEPSQRSYQAACPGCGAPVQFFSAQSAYAVCRYCQSTVVRKGDILARVGKMAELFDDHSPLQLQTSGQWNKRSFTLVGRLQYKYAEGTWNEWHAVLDDGTSAFLSEDNGAYVFATPLEPQADIAPAEHYRVGSTVALLGQTFSVASNQSVVLIAAAGELPRLPQLGKSIAMVELRSQVTNREAGAQGQVLSIDYGTRPPSLSIGGPVLLEDLQLSGLRDASGKEEQARQFACPSCGAQVELLLATSKSVACTSCHSIIDLSQGIGAELRHAVQDEPVQPLIALGAVGQLQGVSWQVVGFQHRVGTDPADPDEQFGWEEYLLYHRNRGFIFLVDASDGWSVVKPTTGAPVMAAGGRSASYLGMRYQLKENYRASTTYVAGEFYWQVTRGQETTNRDFASGKSMLSMEQSASEVIWSIGAQIDSESVAKAFKLEDKKDLLTRKDAGPGSAASKLGIGTVIVVLVVLVMFSSALSRCSSCDPNTENCAASGSSRSSGGSYGGSSGGGGHK